MAFGNGIKITAPFDLAAGESLDSRLVCQSMGELDDLISKNLVYDGMIVYVKDDGTYQLTYNSGEQTWKKTHFLKEGDVKKTTVSVNGDVKDTTFVTGGDSATATLTLKDVNANVGAFTKVTVNAKGLVTAAVAATTADIAASKDKRYVTDEQLAALNAVNGPNGFVKTDAQGYVPTDKINPVILSITTEYADINAMLTAEPPMVKGTLCFVTDASVDPSVASGWAIYRRKVDEASGALQLTNFIKVQEQETLDVQLSWASIQGKPTSTVTNIDDAVTKRHAHANKAALDRLSVDEKGVLKVDDVAVGIKIVVSQEEPTNLKTGDFWYQLPPPAINVQEIETMLNGANIQISKATGEWAAVLTVDAPKAMTVNLGEQVVKGTTSNLQGGDVPYTLTIPAQDITLDAGHNEKKINYSLTPAEDTISVDFVANIPLQGKEIDVNLI